MTALLAGLLPLAAAAAGRGVRARLRATRRWPSRWAPRSQSSACPSAPWLYLPGLGLLGVGLGGSSTSCASNGGAREAARARRARARAAARPRQRRRTGRQLYLEGCASCHGFDGAGVPGKGPDLHGAGAAAADFYLSTGRMPLDVATGEQPLRAQPAYPPDARSRALVALRRLARRAGGPGGRPGARRPRRGPARVHRTTARAATRSMGQGGVVTGSRAAAARAMRRRPSSPRRCASGRT